jgi:hypothetical protein
VFKEAGPRRRTGGSLRGILVSDRGCAALICNLACSQMVREARLNKPNARIRVRTDLSYRSYTLDARARSRARFHTDFHEIAYGQI